MAQNYVNAAIAGAALITAIPSLGGFLQSTGNLTSLRSEAARAGERNHALTLAQQEATAAAEIARQRFEAGCVPVVSQDQQTYVSLVEGQPVVDSATGIPLPVGTLVCDAHGNTGVMVATDGGGPVVGLVAFVGDRALVEARLAQFNGATYSQPTN